MNNTLLKFLIDMGVGKKVEDFLKQNYDVKCIRDIDPCMVDINILKMAVSDNRMVVTMDKDFGELAYNTKLKHTGVLLLRLDDANAKKKLDIVSEILKNYYEMIPGNFCVYQNGKFRIR